MKPFDKPNVTIKNSAVEEQVALEKTQDKSIGIPATAPEAITAADIHKGTIDTFVKFLAGEAHNGSLEERTKFQCMFIDEIPKILSVKYNIVEAVLDHFLIQIADNRQLFGMNEAMGYLYNVEKTKALPIDIITRYKQFLTFMIMLSDNARNRTRFIAGYDVTKLCNTFDPAAGQNLHNYIHR